MKRHVLELDEGEEADKRIYVDVDVKVNVSVDVEVDVSLPVERHDSNGA